MKTAFAAVAVLVLAAGSAAPMQGKDRYPLDGVDWAESWEAATQEAIARNVPIHFAYHGNDKNSMDTAADFLKPGMVNASRNWVNCIVSKEDHETVEIKVGKETKKVCKIYWGIECKVHKDMAANVSKVQGNTGSNFTVPLSWALDTTGKKLQEKVSAGSPLSSGDVSSIMDKALKTWTGERMAYAEWKGYQKARIDVKEGIEKGEWKRAITGAQALQKAKTKMLQVEGKDAMNKLGEKGDELLKEATDLAATDKPAAKKQLQMIANDFKPLMCASRAADFLKSLK